MKSEAADVGSSNHFGVSGSLRTHTVCEKMFCFDGSFFTIVNLFAFNH